MPHYVLRLNELRLLRMEYIYDRIIDPLNDYLYEDRELLQRSQRVCPSVHSLPTTVSQQGSRMMKRIEVVAAIIHDAEGRLFATQRGYGEWKDGWEFPGGKMEAGETPEEALRREIWEELETRIEVERLVETVEYDYPQFHLTMHCYLCRVVSGRLELKEHEAARWLEKEELDEVDWLPADLQIIDNIGRLI